MRKKINIILITSFVILTILIIWINYLMKNHAGDIEFDSSRDNPSFNICNEKHIYQYYSVGTHYKGERKAMREEIYQQLENKELMLDKKDGIITFRFVVSCNGESGRYRYKSVNANFTKTNFKQSEILKIQSAIKSLKSWVPGVNKSEDIVDSYYQINFKIKDGLILDIF